MSTMLPKWAIAPQHQQKVIATEKGWVVEDTGEILVSMKNLNIKLAELHAEINQFLTREQEGDVETPVEEEVPEVTPEDAEAPVVEPEQPQESKPSQQKRRGRKPKTT